MELALIKLLSAHLFGDFFLQPNRWVAEKEEKKLKSGKLYLHVAVHIGLIFLMFLQVSVFPQALIIGASHLIIDACKLQFQKASTKRLWFFADQLMHLLVIVIVWFAFSTEANVDITLLQNEKLWLYVFGALFLTSPTAVIIRVAIARFIPDKNTLSLHNAGKFIGILERLLIYIFITTQHFEAVGFLLAAKSIFRFGDLKEGSDLKLTEYVLIGTLLSFGIAIVIALGIAQINL
jgi:hypothetical protein